MESTAPLMDDHGSDDLGEFRALYTEHHAWVWRLLARIGVPEAAREDALQDVFIIVHRRRADYDGRAPFKSWIAGIARRVASKHARTQARALRRVAALEEPAPQPGPDDSLGLKQAAQLVDRFLGGLSPDHREVFVLAEIEGWTAPEIAASLGIKLGTVYSRLHTARGRFADATAGWQAEGGKRHAP